MPRRHYFILTLFLSLILILGLFISVFVTRTSETLLPTLVSFDTTTSPISSAKSSNLVQEGVSAGQEVIIQYTNASNRNELDLILDDLDAEVVQEIPDSRSVVIVSSNPITPEQVATLSTAVLIEPNYTVHSLLTYPSNDPMIGEQWALNALDIAQSWDAYTGDENITIAVIDSGTCFSHPDLQGRFHDNGFDYVDNDPDPTDEMGHGCAVSGIIAANINNEIGVAGVAPNVKLLPLRVLDENGSGTYANVISAIYDAVEAGADIINLSLGGQNHSQLLEQAVNYAVANGVDVVAGSGNTGQNGVFYPARYANVIAVGSHDENGNRSSFSTYGNEVDTLAPGENILTTRLDNGYGYFTGTSMAVPHVSGLLALSRARGQLIDLANSNPTVSYPTDENVVEALATATAIPPTGTPTPAPPTATPFSPPTSPPFPECSMTGIELITIGSNSITYQVEDVDVVTDVLVDMDHAYYTPNLPVSGTVSLNSITVGENMVWSGGNDADTIGDGVWVGSASLDDNLLTIHYDTNISMIDYYTSDDFYSEMHVFNNEVDDFCTIYPTINLIPDDPLSPTATTISPTVTQSPPTYTPTPTATPISCENYAGDYILGTVQGNLESDLQRAVECANQSIEDNIIDLNGQTVTFYFASSKYDGFGFNALASIQPSSVAGELKIQNGTIERNNGISLCQPNVTDRSLFRLLLTQPNSHLTLSNVTIKNGCALDIGSNSNKNGGGIYNQGTLVVENSLITLNKAIRLGGAIYNADSGSIFVTGCVFTQNAGLSGGGIFKEGDEQLTVENSTFSYNSAYGECNCGGGAINAYHGGEVTVTNSTISHNFADGFGGGIESTYTELTLVDSLVSDNTAFASGGGIYHNNFSPASNIIRTTISRNYATDYAGGLLHQGGELYITDSTISNNNALDGGGGIDVRSTTIVVGSTINNNTTELYGAGIRSAYGGNPLTLTNSTVYGNSSQYRAGGFSLTGSSLTTLYNTTVANNSALQDGGGIFVANDATLTIGNSIIANSPAGADCNQIGGTISFVGLNLVADNTCDASTNGQLTGDPKLDTSGLQLNTGSMPTIPLLSDSPAIDVGDNSLVTGISYDQRGVGFPRIHGTNVDLGAYEYQPIIATNTPSPTPLVTISSTSTPPPTATIAQPTFTPSPTAIPISCDNYTDTYILGTVHSDLENDLRQAIECANESLEGNVIDLNGHTVSFEYAPQGYDYEGFNALKPIADDSSAGKLTIQNGAINRASHLTTCLEDVTDRTQFRLLLTLPNSNLTLTNITIQNGCAFDYLPGAIYSEDGGAIYNLGTLAIQDSTISLNQSGGFGGGIYNAPNGNMTINDSLIAYNSAMSAGGIYNRGDGAIVITNSSVSHNSAGSYGGGIYNYDDGNVTIIDSIITGNFANDSGGGIKNWGIRIDHEAVMTITDSTISDNTSNALGGGINSDSKSILTLNRSIVGENIARYGGGIYSDLRAGNQLNITDSTIHDNTATFRRRWDLQWQTESFARDQFHYL